MRLKAFVAKLTVTFSHLEFHRFLSFPDRHVREIVCRSGRF
jgi:hypothetical protein